jgi:hypothetical protein
VNRFSYTAAESVQNTTDQRGDEMFDLMIAGDAVRDRIGESLRLDEARVGGRKQAKQDSAPRGRVARDGWARIARRTERRQAAPEGVSR